MTSNTFFQNLPIYLKVETARKEVFGKRLMCYLGIDLKSKDSWGKIDDGDGSAGIDMVDKGYIESSKSAE